MAKIRGAKELRAAIKAAGPDLRKEAGTEVKASTDRMHKNARAMMGSAASIAAFWHGKPGMQNISGAARRSYKKSVSRDGMTGKVGILGETAGADSNYGALAMRMFLFGSSHQPARNVHDAAFEDERDAFIHNQGEALEAVLRRMG